MQSNEQVKPDNKYAELAAINVTKNVEKKNGMSYLTWSWAVDELMRQDPQANWSFREPVVYPDGTMMVHCDVTAFSKSMYMWLPVMDHKNAAIKNPNAVQINKAMMRCLVKGIAVHGLGLYIYAGEDLPEEEKQVQQQQRNQQQQARQQQQAANNNQQQAKPTNAAQLTPEKQEAAMQKALAKINATNDPQDLNASLAFFAGTKHEQVIRNACDAKADREGWR